MRKTTNLLMVFIFSAGMGQASASAIPITLQDAFEQAIQYSPSVQGARLQWEGAQAQNKEVTANRFPVLSFHSNFTRSDDPVYVFGSLLRQGQFQEEHFSVDYLNNPPHRNNFANSLKLGIPIFTGFALSDQKKIAEFGEDKAEAGKAGAESLAGLSLVGTYLRVVQLTQNEEILNHRILSSEKELQSAEKLMKRGLVLGSDYYAARALLDGMRAQHQQMAAQKEAALVQFNILLGKESHGGLSTVGNLTVPTYSLPTEEQLILWIESRPDIRMSKADESIAQQSIKFEGRSVSPTMQAFGAIQTNTEDFSSNPTHNMVGVQLDMPFGDPTFFVRRDKAKAYDRAAKNQTLARLDQAKSEVLSLHQGYKGGLQALDPIRQSKAHAATSLKMFRPLYREGRQSVLEVIRAEDSLAKANTAYHDVLFQLHLTYARLLSAVGRLDHQVVNQISTHIQVSETEGGR